MSREIKFRAWNGTMKRYHYNVESAYDSNVGDSFGGVLNDDNLVIEQSTGLKDVNGVDIYENDIIMLDGVDYDGFNFVEYLQIVFSQGCFCFESPKYFQIEDVVDGDVVNVEVIGNAHQNADLLEEQS